jgi:cytosine/adenosine deaminase-related metal-dependent hydrolase
VALLPGLINAHTHLEFSHLTEPIGTPGIALQEWIKLAIRSRLDTTPASKAAAIKAGSVELADCGTRWAGEISTPPCDYERADSSLEIYPFAEVVGLDPLRAEERWDAAMRFLPTVAAAGISPHAPYSTSQVSLDRCLRYARQQNCMVAMHVAEAEDERELLTAGTGSFAQALRELGVWREGLFPWSDLPFERLIEKLATAPRALLIHGNHLQAQEIERLSKNTNLTVVYCPRTHHFFQHPAHPVDRMLAAGVNVALGTDSRASNPDLNLWHEVQYLLDHRPDIAPEDVLRMATINGAKAMGRNDIGKLTPGSRPGFSLLATSANTVAGVFEAMSHQQLRPLRLEGSGLADC